MGGVEVITSYAEAATFLRKGVSSRVFEGRTSTDRLVYAAIGDKTGIQVVVKRQRKLNPSEEIQADFDNEQAVLGSAPFASHPNIIRAVAFLEDATYKMTVLEYIGGGDLLGFIRANAPITEARTFRFAKQILGLLSYIHGAGIYHGDVKPENILLRKPPRWGRIALDVFAVGLGVLQTL